MTDVAKHYPEKEREGEYGKQCRISLFVVRCPVSVDDLLEGRCEFV